VRYLHRTGALADGQPLALHAAEVDLCDPRVELRVSAPEEGGQTVSAWASAVGATVAINGDYFDRGLQPLGPARGDGRWWPEGAREHRDALLLSARTGPLQILEAPALGAAALWQDARTQVDDRFSEVLGVREWLLRHGQLRLSPRLPHDGRRQPRTALGLSADRRRLWMLVIDGRSPASAGATAVELGTLLRDLGAREGFKLDGGGSSTMFLAGHGVVNHPSDGRERVVANHLAVRIRSDVAADAPSWCRTVPPLPASSVPTAPVPVPVPVPVPAPSPPPAPAPSPAPATSGLLRGLLAALAAVTALAVLVRIRRR
jgi:hypothetical protein